VETIAYNNCGEARSLKQTRGIERHAVVVQREISGITFQKIQALRATTLFGNLPEATLSSLSDCFSFRSLQRGEVLYSEHDEASCLYVVANGELRSVRQSIEGREQVLSTERRGSILAAVALFDRGTFFSTLIAEAPSTVLVIARRDFFQLCHCHPELLWNLAKVLARKLRHSAELIETLALRHVDQRVAQYLLTICQKRGIEDRATCIVELTQNRTDIANRLGSAREVVSRAFTQLEKSGLIHMQGRRLVTIPSMSALRTFAGNGSSPPGGTSRANTSTDPENLFEISGAS
jgi:CRP-like cAMP-binding protein